MRERDEGRKRRRGTAEYTNTSCGGETQRGIDQEVGERKRRREGTRKGGTGEVMMRESEEEKIIERDT